MRDREVVAAIVAGDPAGLAEAYDRYATPLYSFCRTMLRALADAGVRPDLVVGTSIGALNGVLVAADPAEAAGRLARMWQGEELQMAFSEKLFGRAARLVRSGTHLHSLEPLRKTLASVLPGDSFSDLELPFQCVAANIEGATARWF